MTEHDKTAERLEREVDDMQHRSAELRDEIGQVREDWARKQTDDRVPGATGEPHDPDAEKPWHDE